MPARNTSSRDLAGLKGELIVSFASSKLRGRMAKTAMLAGVSAFALVGCAQAADEATAGPEQQQGLNVVASTDVYQDLASKVLGEHGTVTAIIEGSAQDPHSHEASPQDKLLLEKADIIVANGGGYDPFIDQLTHSLENEDKVIYAFKGEGHDHSDHEDHDHDDEAHDHEHEDEHDHDHGFENEHIWYDLEEMSHFAEELAEAFAEADAENAEDYRANGKALSDELDELLEKAESINGRGGFLATEAVSEYLLIHAGFTNETDPAFLSAVEHDQDLPPILLKQAEDQLNDGEVKFLSYNTQTETSQTQALKQTAEDNGIPVLDFTENLPENTDFIQWMESNIEQITNLQ